MRQLVTMQKTQIGGKPVVVLPLEDWRAIEDQLEDLEMYSSTKLRKDIAKARKEKKLYSASEVKRMLGISS